jgi:hypothetical protein
MAERCAWTEDANYWDDYPVKWETDCGEAFTFIDDGPTENGIRFCCYCGKPLEIRALQPCDECNGRGYHLEGHAGMDDGAECSACKGAGRRLPEREDA